MISAEWAAVLWRGFLRRIENMSYEEAQYELPYSLLDVFREIYPERCPPETEETQAPAVQQKLPTKATKSVAKKNQEHENANQPSLF